MTLLLDGMGKTMFGRLPTRFTICCKAHGVVKEP